MVWAELRNQHLFPVTFIDTGSNGFNPTSRRTWVTDLTAISAKGVACAALAAFPVVVFFYLDQPLGTPGNETITCPTKEGYKML